MPLFTALLPRGANWGCQPKEGCGVAYTYDARDIIPEDLPRFTSPRHLRSIVQRGLVCRARRCVGRPYCMACVCY